MKSTVISSKLPTLSEFVNRFIPRKTVKQEGVYYYGSDNKLPQEIITLVGGCAALMKALRKRATYIASTGFADEASGNFIVDPKTGKTANQLLAELAFPKSMFSSVDLYVMRDVSGRVASVQATSHELIRRRLDGDFEINNLWGQAEFKKSDGIIYPAFKGLKDTSNIGKYHHNGKPLGEILYHWRKDAVSYHYPIPDWFAGEMDTRTSIELSAMDYEMSVNSFMSSFILTLVGQFEAEKPEGEYSYFDQVNNTLKNFTGGVKNNATGLSDRFRGMLLTAETKDQIPSLQQFDVEKIISGSIEKREAVDRIIAMNCGVNPVLLGYDAANTLGNTQALANASAELANLVESDQQDITDVFKMLWPDKDWSIKRFNPVSYIPDKILDDLTPDERRALVGYQPKQITA